MWIKRVLAKLCFHFVHPDAGPPLHEECVIAVRAEKNFALSVSPLKCHSEMRSP